MPSRSVPGVQRSGDAVGRGDHLLPMVLLVLVPLVTVMLGRSRVIVAVPIAEVADGLGLVVEVGLDGLPIGSVLGGDVQELPRCVQVSRPSVWTSAS